jgi:alpha-glucosidase
VLGNHDQPRIAARVGEKQARIAAMLLLTLRGTPTMYYGDEIGLPRVDVPSELAQDPWEKNEPGLSVGRDPWRTPMQWDASPNAGFSTGRPWLPLDPAYRTRNVTMHRDDPGSILSHYRRLIVIRKRHPALSIGDARVIGSERDVLVFERNWADQRLLILLNFAQESWPLETFTAETTSILLSTELDQRDHPRGLRANEGLILALRPDQNSLRLSR